MLNIRSVKHKLKVFCSDKIQKESLNLDLVPSRITAVQIECQFNLMIFD